MYGFWSDGLRPRPSAGASCVWNGLAANTSIDAKNPAVPARIAVTQGISSGFERRFVTSTVAVKPVSTVSQSSSEPGCDAQNEVTRYAVGSFRRARLGNGLEREVVAEDGGHEHRVGDQDGAEHRVHRAAGGQDQAPVAAAGADHRGDAGVDAQQQREDQRPAAERCHQDCAEDASPGVYFDGHFVTSESVFASKTPLADLPSTTICRPTLNASGMLPWYTTGIVLLVVVVDQLDAHARVGGRVAGERDDLAGQLHVLAGLVTGGRLRDADQRRGVADEGGVDGERAQDGRDHEARRPA